MPGLWLPLRYGLFALAILTFAAALPAQEAQIPPAPRGWVTDGTGLLSPVARGALDRKLAAYERQTGHQVAVWIGPTLGATPIEDFAVKTFKAWGLGRQGEDDGILVVVLAQDRRVAIEVGYGLEAVVPDAVASRVINETMVPALRAGQPGAALDSGVNALLEKIEGKPFAPPDQVTPPAGQKPGAGQIVLYLILGGAFLLLLIRNPTLALSLLFVMAGRGGGRHGGGFGGGFSGGGGRSGGGGARGSW
jgi:uncharacterized protein